MSLPAKPKAPHAPLVVTANRLRDGRVVWLGPHGAWTARIEEALLFSPGQADAARDAGAAGERARLVVGAYAVEVALRAGLPEPLKLRERLRLRGPSIAAEPAASLSLAS